MKQFILAAAIACGITGAAIAQAPPPAPCTPSGGLSFVCGIQNGEDLVLVPNTRWLIASGMAPGSGLHAVDTQAKAARTLYGVGTAATRPDRATYANCPGPLDPKLMVLHGLSLRTAAGGRYTVYATNHGGRESIEVFEIAGGAIPTATWIGCVLMPNGMAANSVAACMAIRSRRLVPGC